jgi:hypothetical protein
MKERKAAASAAGSPYADTYAGSRGAGGKAGNGYAEFWKLTRLVHKNIKNSTRLM